MSRSSYVLSESISDGTEVDDGGRRRVDGTKADDVRLQPT
jgi:hypothetical protein